MKVWDFPTRLYHWIQALLFAGLAFSGLTEQGPHVYLGLTLFTLLTWRLLWGFIGSETSRFSQFVHSPKTVLLYFKGEYKESPGHNPAGGYMVVTLVTALSIQCLSGLALSGMLDPLPGSEYWLNDQIFDVCVFIHENLIDGLFILVSLHLLAIIIYKLQRKPLVKAMFTGVQEHISTKVSLASNRRAIAVFAVSLSITTVIYVLSIE
ncbi:cytochrome b/b6 domain-containing protein [Vibrio algarum]|uniref:Cytochrome b/b6 domain-containing protein n=1 Tax=Vibrio algarum TaxID=3020714 RepID=A0ABT4YPN2_9VIBR|nr:cytochrome b/b6 domain-containing protein [Vibrio sp. KJ40-1]MDB1123522.1 cytochrome b/b6 domain-containing protein [Vibrio sp. KJ40-1]